MLKSWKRAPLGNVMASCTQVDYREGWVIDNYSVAIHGMSIYTLFAVIDTVQQETKEK